jgi:hypothetical protein
MTNSDFFLENSYCVIRNSVDPITLKNMHDTIFFEYSRGATTKRPYGIADCLYGGKVFEHVLLQLLPTIESTVQKFLLPSYAYSRIYRKSEVLKKHTDRPACEFSVTLCVSRPDSTPWPIYLTTKTNEDIECNLEPGDLLLMRGQDLPHWREQLVGEWQVQSFFHYVDYNGPHREWVWDKTKTI